MIDAIKQKQHDKNNSLLTYDVPWFPELELYTRYDDF